VAILLSFLLKFLFGGGGGDRKDIVSN